MSDAPPNRGAALLEADSLRLKACRPGWVLFNPKDLFVGRSFDLYGEFSEGECHIFRQIAGRGMVVLDIGANIGAHTLVLSRLVGAEGAVLAVEPQRRIFHLLCANLALNRIANVRALPVGAGRAPGVAGVPLLDYAAAGNFGGVSLVTGGPAEPVDISAIDTLNLAACHVIKIDVEGMESEVLAGAATTIRRHRPMLYVENDRREKSAALIAELKALRYRLYWHTPPLFNPDNFFGNPENVFANTVSINLLCVPLESSIVLNGFREVAGGDEWFFA